MDSDWCVIRVKSGNEGKMIGVIKDYYSEGVLDLFSPSLCSSGSTEKEDKKRVKSLFPGYVFVRVERGSNFLDKIVQVRVPPCKILSMGDNPRFISDDDIKKIRSSVASFQGGSLSEGLSVGAKVQVSSGPFESYHGFVEEIDKKMQKAKVRMVFCGQNVVVAFGFEQLKLLD